MSQAARAQSFFRMYRFHRHLSPGCCSVYSLLRRSFCGHGSLNQKAAVQQDAYEEEGRSNAVNIQMLPRYLHRHLFGHVSEEDLKCDERTKKAIHSHFAAHGLLDKILEKPKSNKKQVMLDLPKDLGNSIDDHFKIIAQKQAAPYKKQAEFLANNDFPPIPKNWLYVPGWTKYHQDGRTETVVYPDCDAVVFDIEVLMQEGNYPTMATAASPNAWYGWCSGRLTTDALRWNKSVAPADLIPMESTSSDEIIPRLVIGHNVGFDRSFIKEQYSLKGTKMRFLDTMSLHVTICGLTGFQRTLFMAKTKGSRRKEVREHEERSYYSTPNFSWIDVSSLNNLNDVYQLHCHGDPLSKELRNVFFEGTMDQVRAEFQSLMNYCAEDVLATHKVFQQLWPRFMERFPHPVTLAGTLEMSTSYLPVNENWNRYINSANETYDELQRELQLLLERLANEACQLMHDKQYLKDPWLWDLDWKQKPYKSKKIPKEKKSKTAEVKSEEEETAADRVKRVIDVAAKTMYKIPAHMAGYPVWYAELCPTLSENLPAGPSKITIQRRIVPKLLRLTWDGFPLHFDDELGWGYLVPGRELTEQDVLDTELAKQEGKPVFPLEEALAACKPRLSQAVSGVRFTDQDMSDYYLSLDRLGFTDDDSKEIWQKMRLTRDPPKAKTSKRKTKYSRASARELIAEGPHWHTGEGPFKQVDIPGCWFYKIPHKDGPGNRVGNPLAKDFVKTMEDGVLSSKSGDLHVVYKLGKLCSYWKNNQDRIGNQMVVNLTEDELPDPVVNDSEYNKSKTYGAILPRLVTAGTVTRRAVEPTWMTASNPYDDRVGSELKAMVQAPPGYHLVGADVDSQELWIAALLGDASFTGIHGSTVLSWSTLQGTKSEGTDMHSMTAKIMGISREHAKVFNYARIYGAGQKFAKQLLQRFNHKMPQSDINLKVKALFMKTKGQKKAFQEMHPDISDEPIIVKKWHGGSESHMFNKLEEIAKNPEPRTPVLGCQISEALMPAKVDDDFMPSRINWVIQSSAVDYLHLMLVSMRWLMDTYDVDGRFSISIHDEVRYLVSSEDRYRCALALQVTNLLTRSMFAHKLNMPDLPLSVAFFSEVDIDKCMRKETTLDCATPSNPRGLLRTYGIPYGESVDIHKLLDITKHLGLED